MGAPQPIPPGQVIGTADQRVVLFGVPWASYTAQMALRGEAAVPRITYLDGAMELMSPSRDHERIKSYLGCLLEAYALETGLDLSPYGSWTLRAEVAAAGLEPDECYIIGSDQSAKVPNLALEVIWTHGGLDKLEAYHRLGVDEVWVWEKDTLTVNALGPEGYASVTDSVVVAGLDPRRLLTYLERPTAMQAVRALVRALRADSTPQSRDS